jgi:hypothetical protein
MVASQYFDLAEKPHFDIGEETKFTDLVLYAWACWTGKAAINLEPTAAGNLWGVVSTPELAKYQLPLKDDQFLLVDMKFAKFAKPLQAVIRVQYFEGGTSWEKGRRLGLNRHEWRQKLIATHWSMYNALLPDIDQWRKQFATRH